MATMAETMSDFESPDSSSRWNQMKVNSDMSLSNSGIHAIVLSWFILLMSWGTPGAAQTSEEAIIADTTISDTTNTIDNADEDAPNEDDIEAPLPETPPAEPVPPAPSRTSNRITSGVERFTPTEEISADNAVPFPVDI